MKQLIAFTKKEFLEQLRTGKLIILAVIFCLFGIMSPAIAKLTPWLMESMSEQLAESGIIVGKIEVNALTSWTQFFKNMPIVLIIFIVTFSGVLTTEYQKGTLINVITKGLKRWKILITKTFMMAVVWTFGCLISYGITYAYNTYFWDNSIARNVCFAVFCVYLLGLWFITIISLASTVFRSASAVTLSVGATFLLAYLLSRIPVIKEYSPSYLLESTDLLMGISNGSDYFMVVVITLVLIAMNIIVSVIAFNKKNI